MLLTSPNRRPFERFMKNRLAPPFRRVVNDHYAPPPAVERWPGHDPPLQRSLIRYVPLTSGASEAGP